MTEREAIHKLIMFRRILEKGVFPVGYRFDAEPFDLAISALEKQEQDRWIPFKCRNATEDDGTSFDYIMEGHLPEDGQTILITIKPDGHEPVQVDTYYGGGGEECYLDSGYSLCDEAIAWRPLPEAYTEEES